MRLLFKPHWVVAVYFLLVSIFLSKLSFSQSVPAQAPLLPHSPEATALGKFGDIPVGLHTGIPGISIPLFNFGLKTVDVPVSLDYHAAGVKVDELASNVGLNWALNFGGVINVITHGGNDFGPDGWLNAGSTSRTPQTGDIQEDWDGDSNFLSNSTYQYLSRSADGTIDTQPDLFSYSIPGKSGKFFFDQDRNIHTMPYQNIKIEYTLDGYTLIAFVITDEKGNKFYFNNMETTLTTSIGCGGTVGNINTISSTSYYLSRIVTPNAEEIRFYYTSKQYNITNPSSITRYKRMDIGQPQDVSCLDIPDCLTTSTSLVSGLRISSIVNEISREHIDFVYDTGSRLDVPGNEKLNQILIFNGYNQKIKQFDLFHDYFYSAAANSANAEDFRLKLLKVKESGRQPYVFTYNSTVLPPRFSANQDHWGYYNGYKANVNLLPKDPLNSFDTGADRDPDIGFMKAGVMEKITYPTGGQTVFDFESNSTFVNRQEYTIIKEGAGLGASLNQTVSTTFTIPEGATNFSGRWESMAGTGNNGGVGENGFTTIRVTGPNNFLHTFTGNSNGVVSFVRPAISFEPGTYIITITNNTTEAYAIGALSIFWDRSIRVDVAENRPAGGLRVKSISDYSLSGPTKVKNFEYVKTDNSAQSSGVAMFEPQYMFTHFKRDYKINPELIIDCIFRAQQANSVAPLGSVQGGNVIYSNVNVYEDNKQNGYVSNEFETNGNRFGEGYTSTFPLPPVFNNDWLNGLPLKTTTYKYKSSDNSYFPISINEKKYKMEIGNGPNEAFVRGLKAGYIYTELVMGAHTMPARFKVGTYHLYQSWLHLDQEINTNFDQNGQNPAINTVDYFYDNPVHIQTTRVSSTDSQGYTKTSLTNYADDYLAGTTFIDQMRNNHQVSYPVERVEYLSKPNGSWVTGGEIYEYGVSGMGLLDKTYSLNVSPDLNLNQFKFSNANLGQSPVGSAKTNYSYDSHYENRSIFDGYDQYGNVLNVRQADGIPTGYKWAYNFKYPIAECKNATNNEFYLEDFEDSNNSGPAYTGLKGSGGAYTVNWNKPNGRNYIISYRYLEGNTWKIKSEAYTGNSLALTGGSAYDQIRIYPADAQMITYSYLPSTGVSSITDAKGNTNFFVYDEFKRLQFIKDDEGNILKNFSYNYMPEAASQTIFYNTVHSQTFSKNNCTSGTGGSSVQYVVPAGRYTSTISQADADAKAQNDINANGQNYANLQGTCTVYARVELINPAGSTVTGLNNYDAVTTNTADVYIRFYSDAACTNRMNVSIGFTAAMETKTRNVETTTTTTTSQNTSQSTHNTTGNVSEIFVGNKVTSVSGYYYNFRGVLLRTTESNNYYYTIPLSGSNYVSVPTPNQVIPD
ncbi:DUF5977 domain-containing protein [Pedobacter sp. AW1-32]|uniref:DUF5977 domain-containing protein n=1 Tax=Pedobacter sp. AW1-32 TaxID=3383026 RepID=UPI003FEFE10F